MIWDRPFCELSLRLGLMEDTTRMRLIEIHGFTNKWKGIGILYIL
jgi:hypothetical protein